jgi:hypothetical protein
MEFDPDALEAFEGVFEKEKLRFGVGTSAPSRRSQPGTNYGISVFA